MARERYLCGSPGGAHQPAWSAATDQVDGERAPKALAQQRQDLLDEEEGGVTVRHYNSAPTNSSRSGRDPGGQRVPPGSG